MHIFFSLNIPRHSIVAQKLETCLFTPETFAVNRLEEISQEIMEDYPDLLNKSISDLLTPLHNHKLITYDHFSSVAKPVYDQQRESVWPRVALVLYMVKETMILYIYICV